MVLSFIDSKYRLRDDIYPYLLACKKDKARYVEPFLGGGNMLPVTAKLGLPRLCSDIDENVITFFKAVQSGWLPPEHLTEAEYYALKQSKEPSPLRTFAGFQCSFGAKWFGGYARNGKQDYANEGYRKILKSLSGLDDVSFLHCDYRDADIRSDDLVYCDPPYAVSTQDFYKHSFKTDEFWQYIRDWSALGATVLVSEYTAPDDFRSVFAKSKSVFFHWEETGNVKEENLFMWKGRR